MPRGIVEHRGSSNVLLMSRQLVEFSDTGNPERYMYAVPAWLGITIRIIAVFLN